MVIWALTAGIGIYLLAVGIGTQRAAGPARARAAAAAPAAGSADRAAAGVAATASGSAATADSTPDGPGDPAPRVGTHALAEVLGSGPAPAVSPPDGSPLLEFTHPALALLGLTFWIFFVMTGDRLFAWIAFGVVVATVAAGLGWELSRRRTARQETADGPRFPPHLVLAHGAAAVCTFALVVIAAVAAGHG
jgi:heme exporter protein D